MLEKRILTFGTGGLRGTLGEGLDHMNVETVGLATQGVANFLLEWLPEKEKVCAIAYDSRNNSELFAKRAAEVFAGNGIKVYFFEQLMPTPCLSYAVRKLGCDAGVVITASHNPAEYNGYKVYGSDGCQITVEVADRIQEEIKKTIATPIIRQLIFDEGKTRGMISFIGESLLKEYYDEVIKSVTFPGDDRKKDLRIVYTPLNGSGLKPVMDILRKNGFEDIFVVPEQEKPDGNFPTCPYPNPEDDAALSLGCSYANQMETDLLIATDPDSDRLGIMVKNDKGNFIRLTGNETGMLFTDYICHRRVETETMPMDPVFMKTIVTSSMLEQIAASYGLRTVNVLTGFKYIGEQIGLLEKEGKEDSFVLGCEESCGYLCGSYVRDKDGVNAALLACLMADWYKKTGMTLYQKLHELYDRYGYRKNGLYSYRFESKNGMDEMHKIMDSLRSNLNEGKIRELSGAVSRVDDYLLGLNKLPPSNVIRVVLESGNSFVVRPSGTEPKLKIYTDAVGKSMDSAHENEKWLKEEVEELLLCNGLEMETGRSGDE